MQYTLKVLSCKEGGCLAVDKKRLAVYTVS